MTFSHCVFQSRIASRGNMSLVDYASARRPDLDVALHMAIIMAVVRNLLKDGDYCISLLERATSTPTPLREYRVSRRDCTVRINDEMPLRLQPPWPYLLEIIYYEFKTHGGRPNHPDFKRDVQVTVTGDAALSGAVTISTYWWYLILWSDLDPKEGPWSPMRYFIVN